MARLTNPATGATVEVRDEKVALLGSEWQPADKSDATAKKSAPAKKAAPAAKK